MVERSFTGNATPADRVFGMSEQQQPTVKSGLQDFLEKNAGTTSHRLQRQGERQFFLLRVLRWLNGVRRAYNAYHPD